MELAEKAEIADVKSTNTLTDEIDDAFGTDDMSMTTSTDGTNL